MTRPRTERPLEPFKVKVVEQIRLPGPEERRRYLEEAGYNLFNLPSDAVYIDLLTDSGTSAMSDAQWAEIMKGDESYAGSRDYFRLEEEVRGLTGFEHVIPVHQGRMAENLLFGAVVSPGDSVPNNMHFDTTHANVVANGGRAVDLIGPRGLDISDPHPFKGNMDVEALEATIEEVGVDSIPLVMLTVTSNSNGGQPVSMENVRRVREVCDRHGLPLFFDACRFAENAFFVREREDGYADRSVREIAREMFSYGDGCTFSGKKDALVNIGGFLACDDGELARTVTERLILIEGFPTYGGLAGRDLAAMAQGLREVLDEDYLAFRIGQIRMMAEGLADEGVPFMVPVGGHALYLDAKAFCDRIPPSGFPGQALAVALYLEAGVRGVEIGSLMFAEEDPETGEVRHPDLELVRLAVPRRVYTTRHLQYVVDAIASLYERREEIPALELVSAPKQLRHFTAELRPVEA